MESEAHGGEAMRAADEDAGAVASATSTAHGGQAASPFLSHRTRRRTMPATSWLDVFNCDGQFGGSSMLMAACWFSD
ncbi:uncharacterized protein LOC122690817 isoform X2 [Cervus elaphus]|uniref:uncharacterized protein LOC122690817 isoform X2 n=1 Tax=Cervus elaphus TaxID=9860 RepID=UPI001CC3174A|nr:uncharacterized protein LOC122690817 isoform X2 [Cervus elaphus]